MTDSTLREHHHPGAGFKMGLPAGYDVELDPRPEIALAGIAADPDPWGFRTNVVVSTDALDRGMTLRAWQSGADALFERTLTDYLLLDIEHVHVGERAGVRRLAHHNAQGRAITMEQWSTVDGTRGYTLTASVSTLAYPALAYDLAAIAATFRVEPAAAPNGGTP